MKHFLILIVLLGFFIQAKKTNISKPKRTITLTAEDNLPIKADVYEVENSSKPIILLFHQAGYSRGEYLEIAPKLNKLGYTCIAIDQRSGNKINGIENETSIAAKKRNKSVEYADALPDLRAAIQFSLKEYSSKDIILWGSSYSASLVFIVANEFSEHISGILSFAPGEYFTYKTKKIEDYASSINKPVFITSAKNEYKNWKTIYERIPSKMKSKYIPLSNGHHGSKALWKNKEGNEEYWANVTKFLNVNFN